MDTVQAARKIIRDAETSLRKLMEKALSEQRYAEIKDIADLADGVSRLVSQGRAAVSSSPATAPDKAAPVVRRTRKTKPKKKQSGTNGSGYPRFERDENRLVKLGWSKKNKKPYEHRVPREAVFTFAQHLADNVPEGNIFDVDTLLPIENASGEELPSYQVYVTLAWLRDVGAVEKKGRDGYVIRDESLANGRVEEQWNSLPIRSV